MHPDRQKVKNIIDSPKDFKLKPESNVVKFCAILLEKGKVTADELPSIKSWEKFVSLVEQTCDVPLVHSCNAVRLGDHGNTVAFKNQEAQKEIEEEYKAKCFSNKLAEYTYCRNTLEDVFGPIYGPAFIKALDEVWQDNSWENYPKDMYYLAAISVCRDICNNEKEGRYLTDDKDPDYKIITNAIRVFIDEYQKGISGKEITLPAIKLIYGCDSLSRFEHVILPETVVAFTMYRVLGIRKVTVLGPVRFLIEECFGGCTDLVEVVLPSSVQAIKMYAFDDCISLRLLNIPTGCRVSEKAFRPGYIKLVDSISRDIELDKEPHGSKELDTATYIVYSGWYTSGINRFYNTEDWKLV